MIGRVGTRREFDRLRREGRRVGGSLLSMRFVRPIEPDDRRVAYAISTRVGSAVVRNRLRRRLRAIVQAADHDGRVAPGWYLITCQPTSAHLTYQELSTEVERLLVAVGP